MADSYHPSRSDYPDMELSLQAIREYIPDIVITAWDQVGIRFGKKVKDQLKDDNSSSHVKAISVQALSACKKGIKSV